MIPLSRPCLFDTGFEYVRDVLVSGKLSGQGSYTQRCEKWLETSMIAGKAFLTPSGTSALEMAAMLADIKDGDEVIFPSYTYVSSVNAFVLRGAVPVFIDIENDTMNLDARQIEAAISSKTRVIVPVHYAGISCNMNTIMEIARRHGLVVIEDAAQGLTSKYNGKPLGTIGDIGCISFHETKNFTSGGQGGALLVNKTPFVERAEVIHSNGTNRAQFMRGNVSQYSWEDIGSNFMISEVLAALLWSHLEAEDKISQKRKQLWNKYQERLEPAATSTGAFTIPQVPSGCEHNAHIYYVKVTDPDRRSAFMNHMKEHGIAVSPHYMPLHSTTIGKLKGRFIGADVNTTLASKQLIRLPLYHELSAQDQDRVISEMISFFQPS